MSKAAKSSSLTGCNAYIVKDIGAFQAKYEDDDLFYAATDVKVGAGSSFGKFLEFTKNLNSFKKKKFFFQLDERHFGHYYRYHQTFDA